MLKARVVSRLRPKAFLLGPGKQPLYLATTSSPQASGLCSCLLLCSPGVSRACPGVVQAHSVGVSNLQFSH